MMFYGLTRVELLWPFPARAWSKTAQFLLSLVKTNEEDLKFLRALDRL